MPVAQAKRFRRRIDGLMVGCEVCLETVYDRSSLGPLRTQQTGALSRRRQDRWYLRLQLFQQPFAVGLGIFDPDDPVAQSFCAQALMYNLEGRLLFADEHHGLAATNAVGDDVYNGLAFPGSWRAFKL